MQARLVYSTERYRALVDAGGDYITIFRSFLFDADIFRAIRARLQAAEPNLSAGELDDELQSYLSGGRASEEEGRECARVLKERGALYHASFTDPQPVRVSDARLFAAGRNGDQDLDVRGFVLVPHCSSVPLESIRCMSRAQAQDYYGELVEVAKRALLPEGGGGGGGGRCHAFCASHLIRHEHNSGNADDPIMFVHNDFTSAYKRAVLSTFSGGVAEAADQYARVDSLAGFHPAEEVLEQMKGAGITAQQLERSRIVVLNAWRSIGGGDSRTGLRRKPLALCDIRTVSAADLFAEKMSPSGDELKTCSALFSAEHRWYCFPEMTAGELLLFKTYDSDMQPFIPALHTAFDDPSCPMDAPPRVSCEARVLLVSPSTRQRGRPSLSRL